MDILCGFLVGLFVGAVALGIIVLFLIGKWYVGDLREDKSFDDELPSYFMEIAQGGYSRMKKNDFVLLRIRRENYVQKDSQNIQTNKA